MKVRTRKFYTSSIRTIPRKQHWYIEVFTQPAKDYWYARLYHYYDMRIPIRVPGWKLVRRLLEWRGAEMRPRKLTGEIPRDWKDRLLAWDVNQDFVCYENDVRNRKSLGVVEVDPVLYQKIKTTR